MNFVRISEKVCKCLKITPKMFVLSLQQVLDKKEHGYTRYDNCYNPVMIATGFCSINFHKRSNTIKIDT